MYQRAQEFGDLKTHVVRDILAYIRSMNLEVDNKLPREEEFCKILGTSRVTLRAALDMLASYGLIFRRHGKGTFVNIQSLDIKVSFNPVMDIYDMISFSGYKPAVEFLGSEPVPAPEWLWESMGITQEEEVYLIKKIFYADKKFCAYTEDYLKIACLPDTERLRDVAFNLPIFPLLDQEFGIRIEWDKVEIGVAMCGNIPALSSREALKNKPLLTLKGMNYDGSDRPILFTQEFIDASLIKFNQIRKRSITLTLPGQT